MIFRLIRFILHLVRKNFSRILTRFLYVYFSNQRNMTFGQGVKLKGIPDISVVDGACINVCDNVVLNSSNHAYHINMHTPVKLLADKKGAKITIGRNTRIHGSCIHAYESITIGENCLIAANCQIFDGNGHVAFPTDVSQRIHTSGSSKPIVIEDNVWIGANCIILPGAHVSAGSIIAAGSVVNTTIPPMKIVRGNPATLAS